MDQGYGSCSTTGYGSRYGSGGMDRVWVRGLDPYLVFWLVPICLLLSIIHSILHSLIHRNRPKEPSPGGPPFWDVPHVFFCNWVNQSDPVLYQKNGSSHFEMVINWFIIPRMRLNLTYDRQRAITIGSHIQFTSWVSPSYQADSEKKTDPKHVASHLKQHS